MIPELAPGFQNFVPQPLGFLGRDVNLPAVFARVAGARDPRVAPETWPSVK